MNTRALTVCGDCGRRWMPAAQETRGITMSPGECDVCGVEAFVSPAYDYGWPNDGWTEANAVRVKRCPSKAAPE